MDEPNWNQVFKDAALPLAKIADLAGVSLETVRSISSGRAAPRPETRTKLIAAFRAHSRDLARIAKQLEA